MKILLSVLALAMVMTACGGGGSGEGGAGTGGVTARPEVLDTGNPVSSPDSLLTPRRYAVYKYGQKDVLSDAGVVGNVTRNSATLSLGASLTTSLTVLDPVDFGISASGFNALNRRNGGALMLCDPGTGNKSRYVAIAIESTATGTQASPVTSASELAGVSFAQVEDCSYIDRQGNAEKQNNAATTKTGVLTVNADGGVTDNGGHSVSPADFAVLLGGSATAGEPNAYFSVYKFVVGGKSRYFAVGRGLSSGPTSAGYVNLWLPLAED